VLVLGSRIASDRQLSLHVLLPVRPNGTSAWIPADGAEVGSTSRPIEISTEARTVAVFHDGVRLRTFDAVVGVPRPVEGHGWIRIDNLAIRFLAAHIADGTPVAIR
jgi:hypothetical protein